MDATSLLYASFFMLFLHLQYTTGDSSNQLNTESLDAKKCIDSCKLKRNGADFKISGPKGEPGDSMKGPEGDKGEIGSVGPPGTSGKDGAKGEKGATGFKGQQGLVGKHGDKGDKGQGMHGQPGQPGHTGTDTVEILQNQEMPDEGEIPEFGSRDYPGTMVCKFATEEITTTKNLTFLSESPFQADCNLEKNTTCIVPPEKNQQEIEKNAFHYKNKTTAFWSSSLGFGFKDLYGLDIPQMQWLHEQSSYVNLTLRYHCKNSVVVPKSEETRALNLLSWSDNVFGPYPTEDSPFHYTVVEGKDGCKDSESDKNQWKSTDILLESEVMSRLPILDFYIQDIREEEQSFYVELVELCFG